MDLLPLPQVFPREDFGEFDRRPHFRVALLELGQPPRHTNAGFLGICMPRRLYIADCLDYIKMGYDYQPSDITPWVNYAPTRSAARAKIEELSKQAESAEKAVNETRRVLATDPTKLIKFDVFVNNQDDGAFSKLDRAEYAGTFAQLPHTHSKKSESKPSSFNLSLTMKMKRWWSRSTPSIMDRMSQLVVSRSSSPRLKPHEPVF